MTACEFSRNTQLLIVQHLTRVEASTEIVALVEEKFGVSLSRQAVENKSMYLTTHRVLFPEIARCFEVLVVQYCFTPLL